jgi:lysophospholipase L1-like esterase
MTSSPPRSPLARLLTWLVTLPFVVVGVGFVLHTSLDPTVLGKWSTGYALFLAGWWIVVVPLVYVVARWTFRTQVIRLPSGRTLTWRPSAKLLLVLAVGAFFAAGFQHQVRRALGGGVTTQLRSDMFHPFLQNVPTPGKSRMGINRHGFRGAEIDVERRPGTFRVFVFGGSTVFCAPLPLEQTSCEELRRRLAAARPDVAMEVQNAGTDWHTSEHSLIKLLTRVRAFKPDVVVIYHAINDLVRSLTPDAFSVGPYRDDYAHFLGPVSSLVKRDSTWSFVRMRFGHCFSDLLHDQIRVLGPTGEGMAGVRSMFFPKSEEVEVKDWPSLKAFRRNMSDFIRVAEEAGIQVVVATQPSLYRNDLTPTEREVLWSPMAHQDGKTRPSVASMVAGMEQFNQASRELAEAEGTRFVDLAARMPKDLAHLYDDVHYTAKGAALVGEVLAEAVVPLVPAAAGR